MRTCKWFNKFDAIAAIIFGFLIFITNDHKAKDPTILLRFIMHTNITSKRMCTKKQFKKLYKVVFIISYDLLFPLWASQNM